MKKKNEEEEKFENSRKHLKGEGEQNEEKRE